MIALAGQQLDLFAASQGVAPRSPAPIGAAKIVPRDYQQRGIDRAFALWREHVGVLFRQPTGTGKTVSGTTIADRWRSQGDDYRVLVLAHEQQLVEQFADEIETILGDRPAVEMADSHATGREPIIVASRATLIARDQARLARKFDPRLNWLVVIDEAHRWAYKLPSCRPIIDHFGQNPLSRRLGLTATPERSDKTTFEQLFPAVASDYRLYDLDGGPSAVADGWAVEYDQRFVTVEGVDFTALREVAKDFDRAELEMVLSEQETLAKFVEPMLELVGGRRTLIFNAGRDMARKVALYINAKLGCEAALSLDGSYPRPERAEIYRRHQRGAFQFLSVCGLCREGYNDPGIQAVAIFRPTKSRPLAEQMKGRGCRPLKGIFRPGMDAEERRAAIAASAKPNCMIVDLVGVTGLADCASTAHILAQGKPDEVIERANARALAKSGPVDMVEEIHAAEREIAAEHEERRAKEEARQARREAARKAREEREERRRREREEHERRQKLGARVDYSARRVGLGRGAPRGERALAIEATGKQRGYIRHLGLDLRGATITKAQASRIIGQLKSGMSPAEVRRTNRLGGEQKNTGTPKTVLDELRSLLA